MLISNSKCVFLDSTRVALHDSWFILILTYLVVALCTDVYFILYLNNYFASFLKSQLFFFDWLFFTNYMFKQLMGGASFVTVCAYGGHIRDSHSNIFGLINKSSAQLSLKSQTHLLFSLAQAKMAKRVFSQKDLSRGSSKKSQSRQYT